MPTRIVILGTGHAHLYLLEALARTPLSGVETTVVSPSRDKVYAPMLPGIVAGRYREAEAVIDLVRLADAAGARFLHEEALAIDPDRRLVRLAGGSELPYEIASIAVGAPARDQHIAGVRAYGHQVHGLPQLRTAILQLDRVITAGPEKTPRIIVVGDGSWGAELAVALLSRLKQRVGGRGVVSLVSKGMTQFSEAKDISIMLGAAITEVHQHHLQLSNGARVPFDLLVWATEPEAPAIRLDSGLPADGRGFLLVDEHLRSSGARNVFVSGGTAAHQGTEMLPVSGYPRLAEGPVLAANVISLVHGQPPKERVHPEKEPRIELEDLGTGSGVWARWKARLKEARHRKLVRRFQEIRRGPK